MKGGFELGQKALEQINDLLRAQSHAPSQRSNRYERRLSHTPFSTGASFYNDSGETIPANACMLVTGVTGIDETSQYYTVTKPTADYFPLYLVNRALPIQYGMGDDSFGIGDWLLDPAGRVLVNGTPAYGETWGPASGSWLLTEGNSGFTMQGGLGTTAEGNDYSWGYQTLPTASQNYVEYTIDNGLVGFAGGVKLNAANLTGWTGSLYRAGSESDVGIEYQTSETAPNTNGIYKATRDGLFRLTLQGYWKITGIAYPSTVNQDLINTGAQTAGTAHTHPVQQTGHDMYILNAGPKLTIQLYNKLASGGANAVAADAAGNFFWWQHWVPVTGSERYVPVTAQWNVCLHENDKLSLKWVAASMTNHEWNRDGDPLKLRFEYIGDIAEWAAI